MPPRGIKKGSQASPPVREDQAESEATRQLDAARYNQARRLNIAGRSRMNKRQLLAAVNRKKRS